MGISNNGLDKRLCFFELFGYIRVIVVISSNYEGMSTTYTPMIGIVLGILMYFEVFQILTWLLRKVKKGHIA